LKTTFSFVLASADPGMSVRHGNTIAKQSVGGRVEKAREAGRVRTPAVLKILPAVIQFPYSTSAAARVTSSSTIRRQQ
jgi:hypothetical protein